MASLGETIRALLIADAAVLAKVTPAGAPASVARIFPAVIPQGAPSPAVRYLVVVDVPVQTFDGPNERRRSRVQIDAFAKKYLEAQALADAIEGAVGGSQSEWSLAARRDGYEDETETHRVSLDFTT